MSGAITADWLTRPSLQAVFDAVERDGDAARAVGGAVRNTLLGVPVADVDVATTALPDEVVRRALAAGLKPVPTGIEHGTITVVSAGDAYEVTTLREDVETHGRSATVRFGRCWQHDARRRDFTMNALYVDRHGTLYDPVGGLPDLEARRVRFIGDPLLRIREDYLRILRFFRFHAQYGEGPLDAQGLAASQAERAGLAVLSAERVAMELRKLIVAPRAVETVIRMAGAGILELVFPVEADLDAFTALRGLDEVSSQARAPALCLAALAGTGGAHAIGQTAESLRLSNAERRRMERADGVARAARTLALLDREPAEAAIAECLYAHGAEALRDGLLLAVAREGVPVDAGELGARLTQIERTNVPVFPLSGRDLILAGFRPGPEVGALLKQAEDRWISSGFTLGREALLSAALAGAESARS
jgi:poly(A) polymerase